MKRRSLAILMTIVVCLFMASVVEACPTCKSALGNQQRYGNLPQAYMYSILFMMSMPFLLLGSFSAYMYYLIRQSRRRPPLASGVLSETSEHLSGTRSDLRRETVSV